MYDDITYYILIIELYSLIITPLEEPMAVVVVAVAVVAAVAVAAAVVVAVAVAVTVAVDAGVGQSRTHAHSSLAHSFIGVSLMSPGTWSASSSATLVSVAQLDFVFFPDCSEIDLVFVSHGKFAEGSSVGQSGKKTKSIWATLTKVADEMADQVPGDIKDTPMNE